MSGWIMVRLRAALAAAATLTGKRFGLLVASSVVATSAIVAAAATNQPEASPLASVLGVLTLPLLYGVAFLTGSLSILFMIAEQTVFTSLVRPPDYVEANSLLIGSRSVAIVGGKTIGGLLVAVRSPHPVPGGAGGGAFSGHSV